jgi:hypothetical protein
MYSVAINQMPIKVPLACISIISLTLFGLDLTNIIAVSIKMRPGRLIGLIAGYLIIISAIIMIHIKMISQYKIHMNSC